MNYIIPFAFPFDPLAKSSVMPEKTPRPDRLIFLFAWFPAVARFALGGPEINPQVATTTRSTRCPLQCDCFNFDETVDCSHRGLERLPEFGSNTKRLYLEDNRVTFLSESSFSAADDLLLIVLERNEMTYISTLSFCNLRRLEELDLGGNRIQTFSVSSVVGCTAPNLREINLSLNLVTALPRNLSHFAPNLEILNLSYNEIESISIDETYSLLSSLRHLDISRNKIHLIARDDFKHLRATPLEILNLAESGISLIEEGSLEGFDNLSSLSLANNILSHRNVESTLWSLSSSNRSSNSLSRLDLSELLLPNLTVSMLGRFKELVILDVSICDVEYIEPGLFDRLPNLETLHAEFGKLARLENLSTSKKLRRIYLQDNRLTMLNVSELLSLESLDLSYNHFQVIPRSWLIGMRNLQLLNLSHNHIRIVEANAFMQSSIILTLDLSFNSISSLENFGLVRLSKLDVSHNFVSSVGLEAFDHLHQSLTELDLSYNNLTDVDETAFARAPNIQILNLAGNKLHQVLSRKCDGQKRPFVSLQLLKLLDLSDNDLDFIDCEYLSPLRNLVTLNLRENRFRNIGDASLLCIGSLVKLTMSGNYLDAVEVTILKRLQNLEELDLSSNPFRCDCGILPFLRWANSTQVRIVKESEDDSYKCNPGKDFIGSSQIAWENDNFLFSYRPEFERCSQFPKESSTLTLKSLKVNETREHAGRSLFSSRYFSVFCMTTLSGVLLGMTVIFLAWRYRNSFHQMKLLSPRWRVRYREVSDLEAALDSRV